MQSVNSYEIHSPCLDNLYLSKLESIDQKDKQNKLLRLVISSQKQTLDLSEKDLFKKMLNSSDFQSFGIKEFKELQSPEKLIRLDFFYSYENKSKNIQEQGFQKQNTINQEVQKKKQNKQFQRRKRKSYLQIKQLQTNYDGSKEWSKDEITNLSIKTGLSISQVYKWCWDQKKKNSSNNYQNLTKTKTKINKFNYNMDNNITPKKLSFQ